MAIVVPLAFFLFLFLGVTAGLYLGVRKDRERQETLRAMIQRGGTIPPELLVPPVKKFSDLRRGIILISGGLGLSIFIGVMPTDRGVWSVGVIPMLLGAGYLLAWKLTISHEEAAKILEWPLGTLKTQVARAKEHLRKCLLDYEVRPLT